MNAFKLTVAALAASAAFAGAAVARDQVQVSGSSTVLPYAKIVAESFGETSRTSRRRSLNPAAPALASRNSARA